MRLCRPLIAVLATSVGLLSNTYAQDVTYNLSVKITKRDGAPAAGMHVKVGEVLISNKLVPKFEGDLPADGTIHLKELRGGKGRPVHWIFAGPNEEQIDTFRFAGPDAPAVRELTLPLMAGDAAPEVKFLNILTGARSKLSEYRGQVVYLDFWGTWCVPCRQAMLKNEDIMKRRANEWAGKAAIVALSVDENAEVAKQYVIERGWTDIVQVWNADSEKAGWECDARRAFGLDDIPRAVLIGKDGKILWRGDPNRVDPEKMIDEQLR